VFTYAASPILELRIVKKSLQGSSVHEMA